MYVGTAGWPRSEICEPFHQSASQVEPQNRAALHLPRRSRLRAAAATAHSSRFMSVGKIGQKACDCSAKSTTVPGERWLEPLEICGGTWCSTLSGRWDVVVGRMNARPCVVSLKKGSVDAILVTSRGTDAAEAGKWSCTGPAASHTVDRRG